MTPPAGEYSEDQLVQRTTAEFLRDALGWETAHAFHGETFGPAGTLGRRSDRDVVLTRDLRAALERLNPGRPAAAYDAAVEQLAAPALGRDVVHINRDLYALVRDGVPVRYDGPDGRPRDERLRVLDFRTPANNRFLAVRELWVRGPVYRRRLDLVGFVNGLPLLFVECKASTKDVRVAYDRNLTDYRDTVPHVFHHNAVVMLSNGLVGRVGTVTGRYEHFHEWKRLAEEEPGSTAFETMLRGVCDRARFLDLVEHFLLFDDSGRHGLVKILARNHQLLGVNRAFDAVQARGARGSPSGTKLGVFWHTQGSGKSYSMAYLARKVRRRLGANVTFVVVTDREELDDQIADTFVGVGAVARKAEHQAGSGEHLKALLASGTAYVFTLVQKFNDAGAGAYSLRDDVIVLADEAHRTQYGRLAENMRRALPNAAFVAFTGTPLMHTPEDQRTREVFGDYVSTYDFRRAVDDGATVRLFYDNRGEKLRVTAPDLNDRIADAVRAAEDAGELDDAAARAALARALGRDYAVLTAPDRLRRVADDLVWHLAERWETGKAMLVCLDKVTCVKMDELVADAWQRRVAEQAAALDAATDPEARARLEAQLAWLTGTERRVIVSEQQNEVDTFRRWREEENAALAARGDPWRWTFDIAGHRARMKRGDSEAEFKDDAHPFRLAIVCAMWLTGFDVPSLSTLYLDKPMRGHTLMQAIARANRVWEGKSSGLLVDYNGMLRSLRVALATYGEGRPPGAGTQVHEGPAPDADALAGELARALAACEAHLRDCGFDLGALVRAAGFAKLALLDRANRDSAVNAVCRSDEARARFEALARETFKRRRALLGRQDLLDPLRPRADAVEAIYRQLQDDRAAADITRVLVRLYGVVGEAIAPAGAARAPGAPSGKAYDLSGLHFDRLRQEFDRSAARRRDVMALKDAAGRVLGAMVAENPLRADFASRFERIVAEYNQETDRVTIEQTFEALVGLLGDLGAEQQRAVREGLDEAHLAVFDLLCAHGGALGAKDRERVKAVAVALLDGVRREMAELHEWRSRGPATAHVRQFIYDYLWDERTGLPEAYGLAQVQAAAERVFLHVFARGGGEGRSEYAPAPS